TNSADRIDVFVEKARSLLNKEAALAVATNNLDTIAGLDAPSLEVVSEIALASDAAATDFWGTLNGATGWDISALRSLSGSDYFGVDFKAFQNERAIIKFQDCIKLARRLGLPAGKLYAWANPKSGEFEPGEARDLQQAVKAKYDEETWLAIAKPL